jgi:hypothetical protein
MHASCLSCARQTWTERSDSTVALSTTAKMIHDAHQQRDHDAHDHNEAECLAHVEQEEALLLERPLLARRVRDLVGPNHAH